MEENSNEPKPLAKSMVVHVADKAFTIPFPKVRHQFDIENRKHKLTAGTYQMQEKANTASSIFNLNMIDAIAHFAVLAPELPQQCFGVDNYAELDLIQAKQVVKAYLDFAKWYDDIRNEVNRGLFNDSDDSNEDKSN